MTKEQIEKVVATYTAQSDDCDYAEVRDVKQAFVSGAEWIANYLCRIPLDIAISELHGYLKEKLGTEKEKKL